MSDLAAPNRTITGMLADILESKGSTINTLRDTEYKLHGPIAQTPSALTEEEHDKNVIVLLQLVIDHATIIKQLANDIQQTV